MEKRETENNWDSFWLSGRIDDYLNYRQSIGSSEENKKERKGNGTVSSSDRDGANNHAHIGL